MPSIDRIVKLNINHGDIVQWMTDGKQGEAQDRLQELIKRKMMKLLDSKKPIKYDDQGIRIIKKAMISALRGIRWDGSEWLHWRKDKRADNKMRKSKVKVITLYYSDVLGSSERNK